jgi:hypothetical protein
LALLLEVQLTERLPGSSTRKSQLGSEERVMAAKKRRIVLRWEMIVTVAGVVAVSVLLVTCFHVVI